MGILGGLLGGVGSLFGGLLGGNAQADATKEQLRLMSPLINSETALNQLRQQLITGMSMPIFGEMQREVTPLYQQLATLGSPYYQQRQRGSMEATARDFSNQAGNVQQQLNLSGQGFAPSGIQGATLGGMGGMAGQTMSENFLQNLFQNEQMQQAGLAGLTGVMQMFDPQGFLGSVPRQVGWPQIQPNTGMAQGLFGAGQALGGVNWGQVFGGGNNSQQNWTTGTMNPFNMGPTTGTFGGSS